MGEVQKKKSTAAIDMQALVDWYVIVGIYP